LELREVFDRGPHAGDGHGRQCDECVEGVFLELVGGAPSGFVGFREEGDDVTGIEFTSVGAPSVNMKPK
jgi:hypothetical protein